MASRSSRRRAAAPAFPSLPEGVQVGLKILVSDNKETVAEMLGHKEDAEIDALCEQCASVMRQQQLSASSFLARFFNEEILSAHAINHVGKSGKGSAPVLAERIAGEWAKNILFAKSDDESSSDVTSRKRKAKASRDSTEVPSKKK